MRKTLGVFANSSNGVESQEGLKLKYIKQQAVDSRPCFVESQEGLKPHDIVNYSAHSLQPHRRISRRVETRRRAGYPQ